MTLESNWKSPSGSYVYNDIWGYVDPDGREYAIVGSSWGTHFIDVTNPNQPVEVQSFPGQNTNVIWRDFKTYRNFAFGVSDNFNSSLQIFDLDFLPDSVILIYDEDSLSEASHNIFIEGNRAYLINNKVILPGVGTIQNGIRVLDISDPYHPRTLGVLSQSLYSGAHDAFVRNDTVFISDGNTHGLQVVDFTDPQNPVNIGSLTSYPDKGYNHASWATPDGNVMVMTDETHTSSVKVLNTANLSNITVLSTFESHPNAIAHNPFVLDSLAIVSYYHDGVQIFNIQDPANPTFIGSFDTDTTIGNGGNYSGYQGCWGVYPFFPSRNIIASDGSNGLYVTTMDWYVVPPPPPPPPPPTSLEYESENVSLFYPNPSDGKIYLKDPDVQNLRILDLKGREIHSWVNQNTGTVIKIDLDGISSGLYFVELNTLHGRKTRKLIIQ